MFTETLFLEQSLEPEWNQFEVQFRKNSRSNRDTAYVTAGRKHVWVETEESLQLARELYIYYFFFFRLLLNTLSLSGILSLNTTSNSTSLMKRRSLGLIRTTQPRHKTNYFAEEICNVNPAHRKRANKIQPMSAWTQSFFICRNKSDINQVTVTRHFF